MKKVLNTDMYYDPNETRSHNCLFNYVIGVRRCGKTYGTLKDGIKRFLKSGEQFIYLRRYKTELKRFSTILDPLKKENEFPGLDIEIKGKTIYIDGEEAGYGMALSTGKIQKGTNLINVSTIIFDEFIIEVGAYRYLPDETSLFNEFLISISSYRDVTCFFLANAITVTNPYFIHYDLRLPFGKSKFFKRGERLVQMEADETFINYIENTRLGKELKISDSLYAAYAINNNFLLDNNTFVEKKSKDAHHEFNMIYKDKSYGVWRDYKMGIIYVSNDLDPYSKINYTLTTQDHQPNTLLIKRSAEYGAFNTFIHSYKKALVRFEDIRIKNMCYDIFKRSYL